MSIELRTKSFLLHAGCSESCLRQFGHDLLELWKHPDTQGLRIAVDLVAPDFMHLIVDSSGHEVAPSLLEPPSEEFMRHFEFLAIGYGRDSEYGLRYPKNPSHRVTVPTVEYLVPVLGPAIYLEPGVRLVRRS